MHPGLAKPAVATPNPGWWMKTVLSASLPNENWTTATREEAKPLKLTTWQICSLTESWQRMRGGAELRCVRNFHVEICTRRVSAVTNNNSTTAVAESLVQMKIWKRNSLNLFFPAVNSWRIEMLVIECNPWSGRVPSWKQKHDFKKCNFIALCLILRWSHSKPGLPARSPPLSQRHSKQSLLWTSFFNTTFLPILRMMYLMYSGPWRHRIYVNTAHHHHWQSHSHEHLRQHMLTEQACRSKWTIPREEQI